MPVHGKRPVVRIVRSSIEERAKRLLEGRAISEVTVEGELITLRLDNGHFLEFFCEGGFEEKETRHG